MFFVFATLSLYFLLAFYRTVMVLPNKKQMPFLDVQGVWTIFWCAGVVGSFYGTVVTWPETL